MKSPSVSENVKIDPATMPGSASGSTTVAQRAELPRAEVGRRLDQRVGDALERRVHRDDHERQPDVGEHQPHRGVRVADVRLGQADVPERPVERPALGEDHDPRVDARQVARPQRQQHRHEQRGCAPRRVATRAMKYANGTREHDVGDRDQRGQLDRPPDDAQVRRGEDLAEVRERQVVLRALLVNGSTLQNAVISIAAERREVDHEEPRERRA